MSYILIGGNGNDYGRGGRGYDQCDVKTAVECEYPF